MEQLASQEQPPRTADDRSFNVIAISGRLSISDESIRMSVLRDTVRAVDVRPIRE